MNLESYHFYCPPSILFLRLSGSLNDLAGSLLCRFERFGDVTDLDKSITGHGD
jgi:hypothetical protein